MTFITGRRDLERLEIPPWLTIKEAMRIYDELKQMLVTELTSLNVLMGQEEREQEEVRMHYRMQDILFQKYGAVSYTHLTLPTIYSV